ncbi:kinetochore protein Nuf2 [Heteronotia binoei]|uniref:kinetochore protein Nuf2 n=1 Tax=Heteronotia binoei TaxID=13085 RepID=UPI00292D6C99|nr:kinetochore protein Nuf2 [Heteronotia binoei]XP_060088564.1 kinetochore protein Nuf2 [Heteronotia binoei]
MESCTFPKYSNNDIVLHIRNSLLTGGEAKSFSKNDLFPNVKPEVLQVIFMRALQIVYRLRLEDFYVMPVAFETAYPQIFEGYLRFGNLYIHMEKFFPVCRVNDFQMADLISPKPKRTAHFLSGIINFLFFRDSRREVYLEIQSTHKLAVEKVQQLQMSIQKATLKLEKLDTIPADQQEEFKELSQDIQQLEHKLNQEYRQKASTLQEVIGQRRMKITEKTQNLNELKRIICELKEEKEQLKSKITESPEELTSCKERLKETLLKIKKDKGEVIQKYEVYRDLVEMLPACQAEIRMYQEKMRTQAANTDRQLAVLAEIRALEHQIESSKSGLRNSKMEEMSLKRLVTTKREKLTVTDIKIKKIREDMEQRKQAITEYCNQFQEKRGAVCEKLTSIHTEIKQHKAAIQQLNDSLEKEKSKAQEIYLNVRVGLEKYHENLAKIVDSCTSAREGKILELEALTTSFRP